MWYRFGHAQRLCAGARSVVHGRAGLYSRRLCCSEDPCSIPSSRHLRPQGHDPLSVPSSLSPIPSPDGRRCTGTSSRRAAFAPSSRATVTRRRRCSSVASCRSCSSRTCRFPNRRVHARSPSCAGSAAPSGPPALVISSSKELRAAAWNLKERLGIADVLPGDAPGDQVREVLARLLPAAAPHVPAPADVRPAGASWVNRWVAETLDRFAADVARRFDVRLALVSVTVGEEEWFRLHVNPVARPLSERTSPRSWSFIRQVTEGGEPLVVPDLRQHPVFAFEAFPPAGTLRGYAGVPGQRGRRHRDRRALPDRHRAADAGRAGDRRAGGHGPPARPRARDRHRARKGTGAVHRAHAARVDRSDHRAWRTAAAARRRSRARCRAPAAAARH